MDSEPQTVAEGQEPAANGGLEPPADQASKPEAKTFDEAYVKQLRREAASERTKRAELEAQLRERDDAEKSETERLTERVAESERRAATAEAQLLRYEVVADRQLPLGAASHLAGQTREEIEAAADWLASQLSDQQQQKPPSFDGGARRTPEQTKAPEQAHNDFLLGLMGRNPG